MKCDELKDYDYDPDFPFHSRGRFYYADDVDEAIAELKDCKDEWAKQCTRLTAENAELKDECNRLRAEKALMMVKLKRIHGKPKDD